MHSNLQQTFLLFNQVDLAKKCINNINDIRDKKTLDKTIKDFCPDVVFALGGSAISCK